jgi:hypothetical protein
MLVEEIERAINLCQKALDLVALTRPGILMQALEQFLFLCKQRCRRPRPQGRCARQYQYPCRWRANE